VLVSDGEDLEGDVEEAVRKAKAAGVVVHTVGVGTEAGQPVPDFDREGRRTGFKRDSSGQAVVSRLNLATLEAIARGTGGKAFRITPAEASLSGLASAIEGMEQKTLVREFSYRRKERFQAPLAVGLFGIALGLLLPFPEIRWRSAAPRRFSASTRSLAALLALGLVAPAWAQSLAPSPPPPLASPSPAPERRPASELVDELLLRPRRFTEQGREQYAGGNHPQALAAFEQAARTRPQDPRGRFNVADGLYKNGKFEEAATLFRSLGEDAASPLAGPSRFNLGNALFQKQDYRGAVQAYRDALRLAPDDLDARRNLELALRALKEQEEQKKQQQQQKQQQDEKDQKDQKKDGQKDQKQGDQQKKDEGKTERPKTPEQRQDERFRQETGMPKERAMQLLDALQQNEKAEQKKLLLAKRAAKKGTKDW
jgi:Ca-activated chloride channel family protein